jgi:hypothetical protein
MTMDYGMCCARRNPNSEFPNTMQKWYWAAATVGSLDAWYAVPVELLISVTFAGVNTALNSITQCLLNTVRDTRICYPRVSATLESIQGAHSYLHDSFAM